MLVGQVGFHDQKLVKKIHVQKKDNAIVNRLNKTKTESFPDLSAEKERYSDLMRAERKIMYRAQKKEQIETERERKKMEELRSYDRILNVENMQSNKELAARYKSVEDAEDDFM